MRRLALATCFAWALAAQGFAATANLVANGSFDESTSAPGTLGNWSAAGATTVKQRLALDAGRQWFPPIIGGTKNLVPNSSFECGGANWGSYAFGLKGWGY